MPLKSMSQQSRFRASRIALQLEPTSLSLIHFTQRSVRSPIAYPSTCQPERYGSPQNTISEVSTRQEYTSSKKTGNPFGVARSINHHWSCGLEQLRLCNSTTPQSQHAVWWRRRKSTSLGTPCVCIPMVCIGLQTSFRHVSLPLAAAKATYSEAPEGRRGLWMTLRNIETPTPLFA